MARYQTIERFSQATGYTDKAIRAKIYDGTWEHRAGEHGKKF